MKLKTYKIMLVMLAVCLISSSVIYAVVWYSNIVTVTVSEGVSLNVVATNINLGQPIEFTGTVTGETSGTVEIWQCASASDRNHISLVTTATVQTDETFSATWTPTSTGTYHFVAEYTPPPP